MTSTIIYFLFAISYATACIKMVPPDMEGMPVTDMPVTDAPVTNEPVTNEPTTDEPITEEPVTNEPVTDEPITNEPITSEPVTDEPITNEPVTDEPITEAPITDPPAPCTTCDIESLFNRADENEFVYVPLDNDIIPINGDCVSYSVRCFKGPSFLYVQDTDGEPWPFLNGDKFSTITCNDDGIFVYEGENIKIKSLYCSVAV